MTKQKTSSVVIETRGVQRTFPGPAGAVSVLRGVDLRVDRFNSVGIVGPSGSGKSTLLHCLGGLDVPTAGYVEVLGKDLAGLDEGERAAVRSRHIGFVFQLHHLLPQLTALENVVLPTMADGAPAVDAARERASNLLRQVGLGEREGHRPGSLSVGEQARVAIARALVNEPDIIIADEPTGALDASTAERISELLVELHQSRAVALLVATHDTTLVHRMDRIYEIAGGVLRPVPGSS